MKRKNRQVPLIIGGLSALALGTVGFSSWIINYQNLKGDTGSIKVGVEATTLELVDFNITTTDVDLKLDEGVKSNSSGMSSDGSEADLTIGGHIKISVTKDYLSKHAIDKIVFNWKAGSEEKVQAASIDNKIGSSLRADAPTYKYIDLPKEPAGFDLKLDSSITNLNLGENNSGWTTSGTTETKFILEKDYTFTFVWGDFFAAVGPIEFYNSKAEHAADKADYWTKVKEEMDAFKTKVGSITDLQLEASLNQTK